jgi:hypothetical protein
VKPVSRWWTLLLLASACAATPPRPDFGAIGTELREMGRVDQETRNAWIDSEKKKDDAARTDELRKKVVEVDRSNTDRLKKIVEAVGWPRRSDVGKEAASAAWLIAQHTGDRAFQEHALELIEPLLDQGEVAKPSYALLEDRVRCHRGEKQIYGTQYSMKRVDGVMHFGPLTPIDDPEHLDERRKKMGLEPHEEYVATLKKLYGVPDDAVIDP